jgi:hypothetical protein
MLIRLPDKSVVTVDTGGLPQATATGSAGCFTCNLSTPSPGASPSRATKN